MEFTYGPLLAYLPVWLARVLRPAGIGIVAAYSLTFVAAFAAGRPAARVVRRPPRDHARDSATRRSRRSGSPPSFNETVGLNGLLLRFLMPAAALLALHAAAARARRPRPGARARGEPSPLAGIAGFALSRPRSASRCTAGAAAYLAMLAVREPRVLPARRRARGRRRCWCGRSSAATRSGTSLGMAGGALNFPVVPGPPVVVLLAGAAAAAALLPRHLGRDDAVRARRPRRSPSPRA